ncbi:esterase/lipase family protein [Streptomyces sp. CRN 30]|uniref:esterase/lipase family protein n=1 Tax=Streptomyces sp. CRN 30 TaxID=3075613 RepID=UPI002A83996B|nr:alpha/beta fold hydrolase [Streptomyces sp. CRN 30]
MVSEDARPPVPWLTLLRGAALETGWATVRLAGLPLDLAARGARQVTGWLGGEHEAAPPDCADEPGLPVVFVHGLADRASIFSRLRAGLHDCGTGPFVTASYNAYHQDIPTAARALGDQVAQVRELTGGRPVCVVGHSLGGLIARYCVQRLGGDAHVPLVITLATPHGGTAMAQWAPPHPLLRQLRPGSPVLAELAEPCGGCRTRFVCFYSDLDEAVVPANRARLDHPDLRARNVLVHGVGHLMLPLHQPVIDAVRGLLAGTAELPLAG